MQYLQGDVFDKRNITFKETNQLDIKLNGHPVLVPIYIDFKDDYYYYFTLSSQVHLIAMEPERFYPIPKGNGTGLTKSSLVDLKHVYRKRKQSHNIRGTIGSQEAKKLLDYFEKYTQKNIDADCEYLLDLL